MRIKTFPRALAGWALDSGGFSELSMFGEWRTSPAAYVQSVRRYQAEIGHLDWAAIQDWMCEPVILGQTGLTIAEHQQRTVNSYLRLRDIAPDVPWAPVLQGWNLDDYRRCADLYARSGVDLLALPVVGLGTLCRRQATGEAVTIIANLAATGLRLHGFGFKLGGLAKVAGLLASADSMAWSYQARKRPALAGHCHKTCANCIVWARQWYEQVITSIARAHARPLQMGFAL